MTPATFVWIMKICSLLCHDIQGHKPELNKKWVIYGLVIRVLTSVAIATMYNTSQIHDKTLGTLIRSIIHNLAFFMDMLIAAVFIVKSYQLANMLIFCKHFVETNTQVKSYKKAILSNCSFLLSTDSIFGFTFLLNIILLWYHFLSIYTFSHESLIFFVLYASLTLHSCCSKLIPITFCYMTIFLTKVLDSQQQNFASCINEFIISKKHSPSIDSSIVSSIKKFDGLLFKVFCLIELKLAIFHNPGFVKISVQRKFQIDSLDNFILP